MYFFNVGNETNDSIIFSDTSDKAKPEKRKVNTIAFSLIPITFVLFQLKKKLFFFEYYFAYFVAYCLLRPKNHFETMLCHSLVFKIFNKHKYTWISFMLIALRYIYVWRLPTVQYKIIQNKRQPLNSSQAIFVF